MNTLRRRAPILGRSLTLGLALWLAAASLPAQTIRSATAIANLTHNPNTTVSRSGNIRVQSSGYIGTFTLVFNLLSMSPSPSPWPLAIEFWQPGTSPQYQLSTTGSPTNQNEVLQGTFPTGSASTARITLTYQVRVPAGSLPLPGTYIVSYRVDLYAGGLPLGASPVDTRTLSCSIVVANRRDLSVVPTGSPFTLASTSAALAFGELMEGLNRSVDLMARTNVGYSLSVRSTKGGFLDHADPLEPSIVPYVFRVGGLPLSLPAGVSVPIVTGAPATGILGARYPLSITIAPQALLPAEGNYSDTLSLSIVAP